MEINIGETHIRLRSDITDHDLAGHIHKPTMIWPAIYILSGRI